MGPLNESAASLRFFGDDLDPDEVTALLGQEPTEAWRKDDVRKGGTLVHRTGAWRKTVGRRTPAALDEQLGELFAGLTADMSVWASLTSRFKADVFCGLFLRQDNEGLALSPITMDALARRGLVLELDLYGGGAG